MLRPSPAARSFSLRRLATVLMGCVALSAAAAPAEPLAVDEVAPGVFVHVGAVEDWVPGNGGDVANLGFIVGTRCVVVVDSGGTPEVGRRLRAAVERATRVPICHVINTHQHPDHVLGNVAFAGDGVGFVGHAKLGAALAARAPYYLNALQRDFNITMAREDVIYPSVTVSQTLELDLGDRMVELRAWPTAHTDNDLTVYDRRTRTLFLSDLLFVSHMPALDGSLRGWLKVMAEVRRLDVALAVPGHGAVSTDWPGVLAAQQSYLEMLLRDTRAAIKNRQTIQQAVDQVGRDAASSWQLADRFHRRNVTAAYAELEWED
jgi:quinoprotein relay system zinc metallohydrolase 2